MQPVNTFVITARECTRALNQQRARQHPGLRSWAANQWDSARISWRMALLSAFAWLGQLKGSLAASSDWMHPRHPRRTAVTAVAG